MPLRINQVEYIEGKENGDVWPDDDASLYYHFLRSNHMINPITATSLGGNQLAVSGGSGIVYGRHFIVTPETVTPPLSQSGSVLGRLVVKIDIANTEVPVAWEFQSGPTLPPLVQENLLEGGTVFEVPVASYTVSEVAISGLQPVPFTSVDGVWESGIPAALANMATKDELEEKANANIPVGYRLLWEGNAGAGQTLSVPGMDAFNLVKCTSGGRTFELGSSDRVLWDGGTMYQPGPAAHYSIGVRATLSGSGEDARLTLSQCGSMAHNQNGSHGPVAATTINQIFVPITV